jgi:hypothetical protein
MEKNRRTALYDFSVLQNPDTYDMKTVRLRELTLADNLNAIAAQKRANGDEGVFFIEQFKAAIVEVDGEAIGPSNPFRVGELNEKTFRAIKNAIVDMNGGDDDLSVFLKGAQPGPR